MMRMGNGRDAPMALIARAAGLDALPNGSALAYCVPRSVDVVLPFSLGISATNLVMVNR